MKTIKTNILRPNPHSLRMYGAFSFTNDYDLSLFDSIRAEGILEPLVVTVNNEIISGVRRFNVAQMLGILDLPVVCSDKEHVTELDVILHNQQRIKNEVQWTYEFEKIRAELGSKQGVKLSKEDQLKYDKFKDIASKNVSESNRKRVIRAIKIQKELNPEKNEKEIWSDLIRDVDKGKKVNTILKTLEEKKAKIQNISLVNEYENFQHECFKIIQGDALQVTDQINDDSIQCLMTSPPYWSFRFYDQNQSILERIPLGNEPDVDSYIQALTDIFVKYKSKLKSTSSIFINVMDKVHEGKTAKIPYKLSAKMEEFGYHHIQTIMWYKINPQYSVNQKIAQPSCEYILHFTCSLKNYSWNKYWADQLENREFIHPVLYGEDGEVPLLRNLIIPYSYSFKDGEFVTPPLLKTTTINKNPLNKLLEKKGFKLTHTALYSYEIPLLCILPTSQKNDICLDVFSGLGTTGIVAYATDRSFIGVENSKIYAAQSKARFIELFKEKFPEQFEK
jgi:site-specific DNA-methyltransferase (adenine-specific)